MPILLQEDYEYEIPEMRKVHQLFDTEAITDLDSTLEREIYKSEIAGKIHPGDKVAIAVGSRGICNLYRIVEILIKEIKRQGAEPYIVSAMGSHGNGTEEGQREVLAGYGITQETLGVKVITTVDVNYLGKSARGTDVYFDRAAMEADVIIPVNRIKLHTDFTGDIQSGLCKMLVIGLGNHIGCSAIHEEEPDDFADILESAARLILSRCHVAYGIAIIENAYDQTYLIEAVPGERLIEREKELVKIARTKMPTLMIPKIDVLVVEEIGKNISGAGYDPNILGRSSVLKEFSLPVPEIGRMVVLGVTEQSHGNAIGIGLFDVTIEKMLDGLDYEAMYANALACKCIEDIRIPLVAKDEDEAIRVAAKCVRGIDRHKMRLVRIKNTLELGQIEVSDAVLEDIRGSEKIKIVSDI